MHYRVLEKLQRTWVISFFISCSVLPVGGGVVDGKTITIDPVTEGVNGIQLAVGIITVSTESAGGEVEMNATFTLSKPGLLDCTKYHWFQVISDLAPDPANPKYLGKQAPSPGVDPPSGGYDGIPDDTQPWYLNAIEEQAMTSIDLSGNVVLDVSDHPTVQGATFTTWLSRENGVGQFVVLAGFRWSTGKNGGPDTLNPMNGQTGRPVPGDLKMVTQSLQSSGFSKWIATGDVDLQCTGINRQRRLVSTTGPKRNTFRETPERVPEQYLGLSKLEQLEGTDSTFTKEYGQYRIKLAKDAEDCAVYRNKGVSQLILAKGAEITKQDKSVFVKFQRTSGWSLSLTIPAEGGERMPCKLLIEQDGKQLVSTSVRLRKP